MKGFAKFAVLSIMGTVLLLGSVVLGQGKVVLHGDIGNVSDYDSDFLLDITPDNGWEFEEAFVSGPVEFIPDNYLDITNHSKITWDIKVSVVFKNIKSEKKSQKITGVGTATMVRIDNVQFKSIKKKKKTKWIVTVNGVHAPLSAPHTAIIKVYYWKKGKLITKTKERKGKQTDNSGILSWRPKFTGSFGEESKEFVVTATYWASDDAKNFNLH